MLTTRRSPVAASEPGPEITAGEQEIADDPTAGHRQDPGVCADDHAARSLARFRLTVTVEVGR